MPTYEYRCNACHREFEYQQKMSDADLVHCEACGEDKLERLISWTTVRTTSWQSALYSSNPREAIRGTAAVDRSLPQRFTGAEPAKSAESGESAESAEPAEPAEPCDDACACAAEETGGTDSGT